MKPYKNLVVSFVRIWNFTRAETLEILEKIDDKQLLFIPKGSPKWQPLFWEFNCLGRTQLVYARAIREGRMDFKWFEGSELPDKNEFKTRNEIQEFLLNSDKLWRAEITKVRRDEDFIVAWPGFNMNVMNHINGLVAHERLHHGQLIAYFTLAGLELPDKFKRNWAL